MLYWRCCYDEIVWNRNVNFTPWWWSTVVVKRLYIIIGYSSFYIQWNLDNSKSKGPNSFVWIIETLNNWGLKYIHIMARTSFGPWKFVRDMGSSSHWGLIMTPVQEAKSDNLGFFFFSIFYTMIVCRVYSLELPRWGDSNEYTQHTIPW